MKKIFIFVLLLLLVPAICLAEPQMFDDRLCRWLEEELGSSELARRIRNGKESGTNFQNLVISIVGAVDLFTNQELAELGEQLKSLGTMQEQERLKLRADGLLNSRNEWAAAEEYRRILRMHQNTRLGVEFYAAVWNNLGICYVRQFLFERAVECFETSMQFAPHEDTRKYRELAEQLAAGKRPGNGKKTRTPEADDMDPQKKLLRWEEDYRSRQKTG